MIVKGRRREERGRGLGPVGGRCDPKCFLAFEMMKESALRHPCCRAEIVNRGRRETASPDDIAGSFQKPCAGIAVRGIRFDRHVHTKPYQPVGMIVKKPFDCSCPRCMAITGPPLHQMGLASIRSEERRVGKEGRAEWATGSWRR